MAHIERHLAGRLVMTDDLVKRLRERHEHQGYYADWWREAADRIEQLDRLAVITGKINVQLMECAMEQKGRIEQLEAALRKIAQHDMQAIAIDALQPGTRAALGEKKDGSD
ncbi:hypothetical protein [Caudoviricetes sp.]|nr:hypothetical protein [Caudoviricetes sp.]